MSDPTKLTALVRRAARGFEQRFGRRPTVAAAAPGRVNLIGEHTDYADGFVLPIAIERWTVLVADRSRDRTCHVQSTAEPDAARFVPDAELAPGDPLWSNYVRGVVAGCCRAGLEPGGFEALVDGDLPVGGGLSSSAALEVATATLVEALSGRQLDPAAKALLCQHAEHAYARVPCGLMDQFIVSLARPGHAMLLDCRSRLVRHVPLASSEVAVLVVHCGVRHALASGEYAARRRQCEEAARLLAVPALRDATPASLDGAADRLGPLLRRRAEHVVLENERTRRAADALDAADWALVGRLMFESHHSLRDRFEVSCAELDLLVDLAAECRADGLLGARLTGGGFGGCTVNLVATERVDAVRRHVCDGYRQQTGIEPVAFVTAPAGAARIVPLPC